VGVGGALHGRHELVLGAAERRHRTGEPRARCRAVELEGLDVGAERWEEERHEILLGEHLRGPAAIARLELPQEGVVRERVDGLLDGR
jgi:hypothetical protein